MAIASTGDFPTVEDEKEIAALLKSEQVAECPQFKDFNLSPNELLTPHRIAGSAGRLGRSIHNQKKELIW